MEEGRRVEREGKREGKEGTELVGEDTDGRAGVRQKRARREGGQC